MAQPLDLRRLLAAGREITETGRSQAQHIGTDLVAQGRQATDQISAVVDELVSRGPRDRIEDLRQTVRAEVHQQLQTLRSEIETRLATHGQRVADRIALAVEEIRYVVGVEVQRQHASLGLANKDDLAALQRAIQDDLAELAGRMDRQATSPTRRPTPATRPAKAGAKTERPEEPPPN
jgi:polyhydroxyalkanoate synthesis regulator phasin